jgi:hypothetical protein
MSGNTLLNPAGTQDMSGVWPKPGLRLIDQTCPSWGQNMPGSTSGNRNKSRISPAGT